MTIQHIPSSSSPIMVSLLNAFLRSPMAPALDVSPGKIERSRKSMDFFGRSMPVAKGVLIEPAVYGNVSCQVHRPAKAPSNRVMLYFHGGGYCVGSPQSHRHLVARLALETGLSVIAVEYRKAPEHPYPAAIEDALAVYQAVLDQGIRASNTFLAGDSAGGNLVLQTLLGIKEKQLPLPAAGCCISPWTDMTLSGATIRSNATTDYLLSPELLRDFAHCYSAQHPASDGLACPGLSPLFADFSGLPPLLIQAGSEEILLDDSLRLAEQAQAAGVEVTLQIWERMQHVWHYSFRFLKDGQLAIAEIGRFVDRYKS